MWIKPAVAGAAVVTGLALVVGAEGVNAPEDAPEDASSTVQTDQGPDRGHGKGLERGRDERDRPDRRSRPEDAPTGSGPPPHVTRRPDHPRHGEACIRPARYEGGPLEACPWMRVEGRIVPAEPRSYSETEE